LSCFFFRHITHNHLLSSQFFRHVSFMCICIYTSMFLYITEFNYMMFYGRNCLTVCLNFLVLYFHGILKRTVTFVKHI
jgi:hypothetical protein